MIIMPILELTAYRWVRVCCYLSMLMPLLVTPWLLFPYTFGKSVYFFSLVIAAAPWYLFLIVRQPLVRPKASLIIYALIVYLSVLSLSAVFSFDPHRSFWGNQERMTGLWPFIHYALFFLMASSVFRGSKDISRLVGCSVVVSLFVALIAIIQKFNPMLVLQEQGERVGSSLSNPAFLGDYMVISILLSLWLFGRMNDRKRRIGLIVIASLQCVALLWTETRGPILAFYVALFVFIGIRATQRIAWRQRLFYSAAAALMLLAPFLVVLGLESKWVERIPGLSRFAEISHKSETIEARRINWEIAIAGFRERPIVGWGPETYFHVFNKYYDPRIGQFKLMKQWFDHPHNKPLEQLSDGGLIGGIGYLLSIVLVLSHLILSWRQKLIDLDTFSLGVAIGAAYLVQSLFLFDHPVGLLMLSMSLAWWHSASLPSVHAAERGSLLKANRQGTALILLLVVMALSAIYWFALVAKPAWVSRQLRHAVSVSSSDFNQSMLGIEAALTIDQQYRSQAAEQYAGAIIQHSRRLAKPDSATRDRLERAYALLEDIAAVGPTHGFRSLLMALLQVELAKVDSTHLDLALSDINDAIAASPARAQLLSTKSRILMSRGEFEEAVQVLQAVVRLDPVSVDALKELGTAQFKVGRREQAIATLRKAQLLESATTQEP